MSNDLRWDPDENLDIGLERLNQSSGSKDGFDTRSQTLAATVHLEEFAAVIEKVIVPRLLLNHVRPVSSNQSQGELRPNSVSDFVKLTTHENPDAAVQFVRTLIARGVPFQSILVDLMAPAARELGEQWVHDSSSFVEVTLGVARMHRILREFDGVPAHLWSTAGEGRHALLMPVPGEHHTFGLRILQEFLLRESWSVTNYQVESETQLTDVLRSGHFDVVGLSLSGETLLTPFLSAIRQVRIQSRNPRIKIIVGGGYFAKRPELAGECGADAYAPDAHSSVEIMNRWASELSAVH